MITNQKLVAKVCLRLLWNVVCGENKVHNEQTFRPKGRTWSQEWKPRCAPRSAFGCCILVQAQTDSRWDNSGFDSPRIGPIASHAFPSPRYLENPSV